MHRQGSLNQKSLLLHKVRSFHLIQSDFLQRENDIRFHLFSFAAPVEEIASASLSPFFVLCLFAKAGFYVRRQ